MLPASKPKTEECFEHHKDGSVRARGQMLDGQLPDYWEWFRKDGVRMRSGHFKGSVQSGE
ncbi:MAG: hypothetical protein ABJA60_09560 [Nitrosospira sp.]